MPLAAPTVLLGFLLPWTWGISSRLLQQSVASAPYLGRGGSLTAAPPYLERGVASFGPPAPSCVMYLLCAYWIPSTKLGSWDVLSSSFFQQPYKVNIIKITL